MLSTALLLSWMVGVPRRMALHTQQSYCFGNLPMERGLVITWFTPTSFHPSEHWIILDRAHERKKYSSRSLIFGLGSVSFMLANLDWKLSAPTVLYPSATVFPPCCLSCLSDDFRKHRYDAVTRHPPQAKISLI